MARNPKDDWFGEFYEPEVDEALYKHRVIAAKDRAKLNKRQNIHNEVGESPPLSPEILERREKYKYDFVALHEEVFPQSTGVKEFGEVQKKSIQFGNHIFRSGGRLLKLEPRGYAKTTRIANECLAAVLLGMQRYVLIVCSNLQKAEEILDSIRTELYNNDELLELFPGPIACFRHLDETSQKAPYQTYGGANTYIKYGTKGLRFPQVPGEPSSGRYIEVRPLKNLKGLFHKVKAGPDANKVYRPTLIVFDDPQTEDEARSPTEVQTIISNIKRSALKGGSHSRRVSAIMAITPVCNGDVAYHFEKNEYSWEIVKYKMLEERPEADEEWLTEYAKIYLGYDRTIIGDRTRAGLEARKYVEDNYERLHKGAKVSWDWAFGWEEEPQIEISPVQHAYNIILDDGIVDFEYEYQCNTEYGEYEEGETIHAPINVIMKKMGPWRKRHIPQWTAKTVCHIDVNKDFLSYAVMSSANPLKSHISEYSTFPKQPGTFSKRNMIIPLRSSYPNYPDYRDVLYLAVKDLIEYIHNLTLYREDGMEIKVDLIGVDMRYEENYIIRACKDSPYSNIVIPCAGVYVGPDDQLIHDRTYQEGTRRYHNCVERPNKSRTADILEYDTNYFKTEVHKGWNIDEGIRGTLTVYREDHPEAHKVLADHCNSEKPKRKQGFKTTNTRIVWEETMHQVDNEYFDNIVGCYALMARSGISTVLDKNEPITKEEKQNDIQEWMNQHKNRKLL